MLIIDDHDDHDHVQVHEEVKRECAKGSLTAANIQDAAPRLLVEKPYHIFHNVHWLLHYCIIAKIIANIIVANIQEAFGQKLHKVHCS